MSLEAQTGELVIPICDEERRPLQPIQIDEISQHPPTEALSFYGRIAATQALNPA